MKTIDINGFDHESLVRLVAKLLTMNNQVFLHVCSTQVGGKTTIFMSAHEDPRNASEFHCAVCTESNAHS